MLRLLRFFFGWKVAELNTARRSIIWGHTTSAAAQRLASAVAEIATLQSAYLHAFDAPKTSLHSHQHIHLPLHPNFAVKSPLRTFESKFQSFR